jgi:hypothetical protein
MPALDRSNPTAWGDACNRSIVEERVQDVIAGDWGIVHERFSAPDPDPYGMGDWLPKA